MLSRDLRLWVFKHKPSYFIYGNTGTALTVQSTVSCSVHCMWTDFLASCCRLFIKLIIVSVASVKFIQAFHPVFYPMSNVKMWICISTVRRKASDDRPWQYGARSLMRLSVFLWSDGLMSDRSIDPSDTTKSLFVVNRHVTGHGSCIH